MGASKLTRRAARAVAEEMLAAGTADPPAVFDGGALHRRLRFDDDYVGRLWTRRARDGGLELVAVITPSCPVGERRLERVLRVGPRWIVPVRTTRRLRGT